MSAPHPLNQAVVAQALHDLRNGSLRRCHAMGFGTEELEALKEPALVSLLINASVSWCSVTINRDVLRRLMTRMRDMERDIVAIDRMLRLGASSDMVQRYFGLTHQEVALRRDVIGLPRRKGRHRVLDEHEEAALWHRWKAGIADRGLSVVDEMQMLSLAMDLAEAMSIPLVVAWTAIQGWIEQERR